MFYNIFNALWLVERLYINCAQAILTTQYPCRVRLMVRLAQ